MICLEGIHEADARACAHALQEKLSAVAGPFVLVFAQSAHTEAIASLLSVKVDACIASRVLSLPDRSSGFRVRRSIYTGKAFEEVSLEGERKLLLIQKNITLAAGKAIASPRLERVQVSAPTEAPIRVKKEEKAAQDISLSEADIVVSGDEA